jgi:hypothetical protein
MAFKVNTGPEGSISGRGARRKRARIDTAAVGAKRRTCETPGTRVGVGSRDRRRRSVGGVDWL